MHSSLVPDEDQSQNLVVTDESGDVVGYDGNELPSKWELQKLSPKHRQVAALVAQGMKLTEVAPIVGYTPEYISLLLRQKVMKDHILAMGEVVGARLDALFAGSVDVIADVMRNGNNKEKLQAARLQMEATKRLGRSDVLTIQTQNPDERFAQLGQRLVDLFKSSQNAEFYNEDGTPKQLTLQGEIVPAVVDATATVVPSEG